MSEEESLMLAGDPVNSNQNDVLQYWYMILEMPLIGQVLKKMPI